MQEGQLQGLEVHLFSVMALEYCITRYATITLQHFQRAIKMHFFRKAFGNVYNQAISKLCHIRLIKKVNSYNYKFTIFLL